VADTVDGFLRVGERDGLEGEVINLGSGVEAKISDLAAEIIGLIGRPVHIEIDTSRMRPEKSEVMRLLSDNRLARERLGWQPTVSLQEGLQRTITWIKQHLNYYRPDSYQV